MNLRPFFKENVINTDSKCFRIKLLTLENIADRNRIKKETPSNE